jgi:hypothetical protein
MATKITTALIDAGAITSALITDASITADDLHTTLDLTGKTVTVATATAGDNDTSVASTAFVATAIANLADSAPETLNTLNELAAALGDDANFSTTVTNSIATKLPLSGGTMTGDLAMGANAITSTGTISSGAITSTGILTLDTSPASNGTGDLVIIPSLSSPSGVGYAGQVFGVNVKNAVHSTHNAPQVSSTWGGVTGATAIAIQADDNTYGQFQVWTAPQDSSADDLLTPKFYIAGSGNATFTGTIASNINGNNTVGGNIVLGPSSVSSKWYAITGRQYDSGTETEGYSLITGASSTDANNVTIGGGLDEQNAATTVNIKVAANTTTRNGTEVVRVTTDGLDVRNNVLRITGTTVIDASRNLSNIATLTVGGTSSLQACNPVTDNAYDLGTTLLRWRNLYTTDLHLSNEGKPEGNEVDGTTGNWTIQEGDENLYILNNKTGKKYKFALEEIT